MILPSYSEKAWSRYEQRRDEIEDNKQAISRGATPLQIEKDQNQIQKRLYRLGNTPEVARERLIGNNDMVHVQYLSQLSRMCSTVGRIALEDGQGNVQSYGTGFMIGQGLLLTNNHVINSREAAEFAYLDFNYQLGEDGKLLPAYRFRINNKGLFITSDSDSGLDFTLIEVIPDVVNGKSLDDFGWNRLFGERGKAVTGEAMVVIQHPQGEVKKVALRNNKLLSIFEDFLQYETDTLQGSSGGLVCNISLEVVALHHSSVPKKDQQGNILTTAGDAYDPARHSDTEIAWVANEGVRISSILKEAARQAEALPPEQRKLLEKLDGRAFYPGNGNGSKPTENTALASADAPTIADAPPITDKATAGVPLTLLLTIAPGSAGAYALQLVTQKYGIAPQPVLDDPSEKHPAMRLLYHITLPKGDHPWLLAQEMAAIPGVTEATPELPHLTYVDTTLDSLLDEQPSVAREALLRPYRQVQKEGFDYHGDWNEPEKLAGYQQRFAAYTNIQFTRLWNHANARFSDAGALLNGSQQEIPRIAQFDTGYTLHPESANLLIREGRDFVDDDNDAADRLLKGILRNPMHGTRTAAVICGAATQLPNEGNDGVLPGAGVVPFRISNSVILISRFRQVANAVKYAVANRFRVISLSMGVLPGHRQWEALVKYAYDNGIIWVCAAGNQVKFVVAPARYPGTVCVAASNAADQPWKGTCRGRQVDITAPGEDIYVPILNHQNEPDYAYGSGTSYAAPHVAAAAAMWLKYHGPALEAAYPQPWQLVEAFRWCLRQSARKPVPLQQKDGSEVAQQWDEANYGPGLLDAATLLQTALPPASSLLNAYLQPALEVASDVQSNILAQEIQYHYFNGADTADPAFINTECYTQDTQHPMSPQAQAYYELLEQSQPKDRESTGGKEQPEQVIRLLLNEGE